MTRRLPSFVTIKSFGRGRRLAQGLSGKAAKALGLTIPPKLLLTVDDVIDRTQFAACMSPFMCWFLDAGNNERTARSTGRRPKSAKARSRGKLGNG